MEHGVGGTSAAPSSPAPCSPASGWDAVVEAAERAATHYRDGEAVGFQRVSGYESPDLAYIVEIERFWGPFQLTSS